MSEIEVAGIKFKGGKIVIILTALGSIGTALWSGFVFYQDYLNLVDKVKDAREVRTDLRADMTLVEKQISEVDKRSRENVKDTSTSIRNNESQIRSLINEAETRFGEKRNLIEQDSSRRAESFSKLLIDLETRFDTKLERALTNPLAGK